MTEYTPHPLPTVEGDPMQISETGAPTLWEMTTAARNVAACEQIEQADAIQYESGNRVIIITAGWRSRYQVSYFARHGGDLIPTMHEDRNTAMQAALEIPDTYQPTAAIIY